MSDRLHTISTGTFDGFPSSNIHVLQDEDGLVVVDTGCSSEWATERTSDGFAALNLSPGDIHTILLTHAHVDHAGGIGALQKRGASPERILIHGREYEAARDLDALQEGFDFPLLARLYPDRFGPGSSGLGTIKSRVFHGPCPWKCAPVTGVFEDFEEIRAGSYRFVVIPCGGHSIGHVAFYEKNTRTLVAGDAVGAVPAWHTPSAGGPVAYLEGLERLAGLEAERLLVSHGRNPKDAARAIARGRKKILDKEGQIRKALAQISLTFEDLRMAVTGDKRALRIFPTALMLEGHLLKLEAEGAVSRRGDVVRLIA